MRLKWTVINQWRGWWHRDFTILGVEVSTFDRSDSYWWWNVQVGLFGFVLVVGVVDESDDEEWRSHN